MSHDLEQLVRSEGDHILPVHSGHSAVSTPLTTHSCSYRAVTNPKKQAISHDLKLTSCAMKLVVSSICPHSGMVTCAASHCVLTTPLRTPGPSFLLYRCPTAPHPSFTPSHALSHFHRVMLYKTFKVLSFHGTSRSFFESHSVFCAVTTVLGDQNTSVKEENRDLGTLLTSWDAGRAASVDCDKWLTACFLWMASGVKELCTLYSLTILIILTVHMLL